jgi:hypothetical protein
MRVPSEASRAIFLGLAFDRNTSTSSDSREIRGARSGNVGQRPLEDMRGIGVKATLAGTNNPWHCSAVTNFESRTSLRDSTGMFRAKRTNCVKTSLAVWSVRADCS